MISPEREAEILRLHHAEKWGVGTIARQLGLHHYTVGRVLQQAGVVPARPSRPSIVEAYLPFIRETLEKYPTLTSSRLYDMVRERGYPGRPDHFRHLIAGLRPRRPAEAYLRLRTLPGQQAQVDWGHFERIVIGRAVRMLMAFVMVLSYSRMTFLRFYLDSKMPNFVRGHVDAFSFFEGLARVLLYDNLKSAVLERHGDAIRFNPKLLELKKHYRFEARPVAQYRGNQKGRVERKIRDIRQSFFAARSFRDIDDLNVQALRWCTTIAADRRCPEDPSRTVREVFAEEKPRLIALPDEPFDTHERIEVSVRKQPYARFDRNDYSVPHDRVRRTLVVVADLKTVRVLDGTDVVATHPRTFDAGQQVEQAEHIERLREHKRKARARSLLDYLHRAAPNVADLLHRAAERGANLSRMTTELRRLLDQYGAEMFQRAVQEAVDRDTPHAGAVGQVLETYRSARGEPPPLAPRLPDDPRVRDAVVTAHDLKTYDSLAGDTHDE